MKKAYISNKDLEKFIHSFVDSTKDYVYIRKEDNLIILRPNKVHHLNKTALYFLSRIYKEHPISIEKIIKESSKKFSQSEERIKNDLYNLMISVSAILKDKTLEAPSVKFKKFNTFAIKYPVISEIALTYRCQNKCIFCYASSQDRGNRQKEMTTEEVKIVIEKISKQAKVPTLSFTGGEPTLRGDIFELIKYARSLGLRVNLITNGIICGNEKFVMKLKEAGLHSAQVSLEAIDPDLHNKIVQNKGAFQATIKGLKNLIKHGIHTHTNTTLCGENIHHIYDLIDFLVDLGQEYFSMNMVIRTGGGVENKDIFPGYTEIAKVLPSIIKYAREKGIRPVWYSPTPYCIFNPVEYGLGSKSCAACDGLLSVDPEGNILPCSSFSQGVGSLLKDDFSKVWNTRVALYWRKKEFIPPGCRDCSMVNICGGACPLYWDAAGSFEELYPYWKKVSKVNIWWWNIKRKYKGKTFGIKVEPKRILAK